jgi:hypothetical protein
VTPISSPACSRLHVTRNVRRVHTLALILSLLLSWARSTAAQPSPSETDATAVSPPAAPASRRSATPPPPAPARDAVQAALARYAHEPSADEIVQAAVSAAPRGQTEALAERARTAGWIPRVGLRARRGQGVDLATLQAGGLRLSTDDDLMLEASLTFDFDRVVFRSEEVALAREARTERHVRAALVREIVKLYFERRRLQVELDLELARDPEASARIAEIEALLDIFTNGVFRQMMRRARWKTAASTPASTSPSPPKSRSETRP